MTNLLEQLKNRRIALGLKQGDMMLRVGMSRQQYQRLESKGNPRLDTLELIAEGLKSELMLIPREKLGAVLAVLTNDGNAMAGKSAGDSGLTGGMHEGVREKKSLSDDPWQDLLSDTE
ncbi:MAG: helix-turn-helix transcriptional regulator [Pseudohongiellaceae bacterium]